MLDEIDIVPVTDTLGTGVFEVVCVVVDVNDCDELLDRVIELLTDNVGSEVLLSDNDVDIDADDEADADELAVCVTEPDTVAAMLVDGDAVGDDDIDCTGPV
jgi:hypothetical protein